MQKITPYTSDQEVFDKVAIHLFTQGRPAKRSTSSVRCMYLTNKGLQCAVGCLIPCKDMATRMDHQCNTSILELMDKKGDTESKVTDYLQGLFENITPKFLADLQNTHDTPVYWRDSIAMRQQLSRVAYKYSLDASIVDTLSFTTVGIERR